MQRRPLSLLALTLLASGAVGGETAPATELETVVVTAVPMKDLLRIETDPRQPRQPLPAHDGADYLKTIPGFNVVRKGGTDGDPVFRGMAASRINILTDGEMLLGGCGMRMDPPTAYIFPEAYDRITVIKGPQTVLHGPGNSAATVLFERDSKRRYDTGWEADASVTGASFGRNDEVLNVRGGTRRVYTELTGTRAEADDYTDGAGNDVHSSYERWSTNGALGWTPDEDTTVELTGALSDGEAAYADRMMDGAEFERENVGLKFAREDISDVVRGFEARAYYNYIDHVMDNYSLRDFTPSAMMPNPAASNPDRRTVGGRTQIDLQLSEAVMLQAGLDYQQNDHSTRSTMNELLMPWEEMARVDDANFRDTGVFGELSWDLDGSRRVVAGARLDGWEAEDERDTLRMGMSMSPVMRSAATMGAGTSVGGNTPMAMASGTVMNMNDTMTGNSGMAMPSMVPNPTAGETRDDLLTSGFARYEYGLPDWQSTAYVGLGYVERFPDYWELVSDKESETSLSAFDTRPEQTAQLDIGLLREGERFSASANLFYGQVDDFILIESNYAKGMRTTTVTRNVDAHTFGGELGLGYRWHPHWRIDNTLAYTRGENETDDQPLAQQPPLENRTSLNYDNGTWSAGALLRLVADQDRVAVNQGTIVGQDLGETDGFAVFSLNAGWRITPALQLTAGLDNLFDENYAEHISRGGAMVSGFTQTERVNEPGRIGWLKLALSID